MSNQIFKSKFQLTGSVTFFLNIFTTNEYSVQNSSLLNDDSFQRGI